MQQELLKSSRESQHLKGRVAAMNEDVLRLSGTVQDREQMIVSLNGRIRDLEKSLVTGIGFDE
ncbi:MAG: hypothetical protein ACKO96_35930, partial [Flammeovirgaceae bacterium]